jgi:hypothetical protein
MFVSVQALPELFFGWQLYDDDRRIVAYCSQTILIYFIVASAVPCRVKLCKLSQSRNAGQDRGSAGSALYYGRRACGFSLSRHVHARHVSTARISKFTSQQQRLKLSSQEQDFGLKNQFEKTSKSVVLTKNRKFGGCVVKGSVQWDSTGVKTRLKPSVPINYSCPQCIYFHFKGTSQREH